MPEWVKKGELFLKKVINWNPTTNDGWVKFCYSYKPTLGHLVSIWTSDPRKREAHSSAVLTTSVKLLRKKVLFVIGCVWALIF